MKRSDIWIGSLDYYNEYTSTLLKVLKLVISSRTQIWAQSQIFHLSIFTDGQHSRGPDFDKMCFPGMETFEISVSTFESKAIVANILKMQ